MKITLSPMRGLPGQPATKLHVAGDVLTIDGTPYDLSSVPEGGEGEWPDSPIIRKITRKSGALHVTVQVILGDTAESNQPTDPAHWVIPDASGYVMIPTKRKPQEVTE